MNEFPQKGWFRTSLGPIHPKNWCSYSTSDRRPGSCSHPNSVCRPTDNIAVVQDLICSQDDEVMRHVLRGAPCRSTGTF